MNRSIRSLATIATLFLTLNVVMAAEEISHSVQFPTGDAAWTITLDRSKNAAAPDTSAEQPETSSGPRRIKKLNVVRMGSLRRDNIFWTDGSTTQYWILSKPPIALFETAPGGSIGTMRRSQLGDREFDARTFSWVSASTFKGMEQFKGKKCRRYDNAQDVVDGEKQVLSAWIDNESSKPVAWSNGLQTAIFAFDQPLPQEPLVLPEKFAKELAFREAYSAPPERVGKEKSAR